jgi:hypothetical protein
MVSHGQTPPLEYAPRRSWRRFLPRPRTIIIAIAILIAYEVYQWSDTIEKAAREWWACNQIYRAQQSCFGRNDPPTRVVYDDDPRTIGLLVGDPTGEYYSVTSAISFDLPFDSRPHYIRVYAWRPTGWREFLQSVGGSAEPASPGILSGRIAIQGIAFLHAMKTPSGNDRLVSVMVTGSGGIQEVFRSYVWQPGTRSTRPRFIGDTAGQPLLVVQFHPINSSSCVYAGQPDPLVPSHFTIAMQVDDQRLSIDGLLGDDDRVHLTPLEGRREKFSDTNCEVWAVGELRPLESELARLRQEAGDTSTKGVKP